MYKTIENKLKGGSKEEQLYQNALCLRFQGKCKEAVKLFEEAIILEHLPSCAELADMLIEGREGVDMDQNRAFNILNEQYCIIVKNKLVNFEKYLTDIGTPYPINNFDKSRLLDMENVINVLEKLSTNLLDVSKCIVDEYKFSERKDVNETFVEIINYYARYGFYDTNDNLTRLTPQTLIHDLIHEISRDRKKIFKKLDISDVMKTIIDLLMTSFNKTLKDFKIFKAIEDPYCTNSNFTLINDFLDNLADKDCQGVISRCYYYGYGCNTNNENNEKSKKFALSSANKKSKFGQYMLGILYKEDIMKGEALDQFKLAAAQNYDKALNKLGILTVNIALVKKAAKQGLGLAELTLGIYYKKKMILKKHYYG